MQPLPEPRLRERLAQVATRARLQHLLYAAAAALVAGSLLFVLARLSGAGSHVRAIVALGAALAAFASVMACTRNLRSRRSAAILIERADPNLRNLVVTAEELLDAPGQTPPYMRTRVMADATDRLQGTELSRAVPLKRAAAITAVAALFSVGLVQLAPERIFRGLTQTSPDRTSAARTQRPADLVVEIIPPAYTERPPSHLQNPSAIEAIAGSRATVVLTPVAVGLDPRVRVNGADLLTRRDGARQVAELSLTESGYLAVDRTGGAPRLVPIAVVPDRAPDVRITAPARDLRIDDRSQSIAIDASAQDDLGLASMEVRYTRISGTGEQFEFHEGTLPIAIDRASGSQWKGKARLALGSMKLEPGDALVYRAVARDRRPGDAGEGSSDTYFVEVAGPGDVALAGFDMPPDRERYALSQQMIVLKIERLRAKEPSMSKAAVAEAAAGIAAEQRAVRANFVFLLGGTVEDEEQEAEGSNEILEGRFENRARQEILTATRLMSRAEQALSAATTGEALPPAREAAKALQRAFGHSRYLLRALPDRGRVDPARRLTGDRTAAEDWRRALVSPSPDSRIAAARDALRELLAIAAVAGTDRDRSLSDRAGQLAERVLRIDASSADLQAASREVMTAREALASGQHAEARAALERAAPAIVTRAQRDRIDVTGQPTVLDRLMGALPRDGGRR